jgi:hypothetical protein
MQTRPLAGLLALFVVVALGACDDSVAPDQDLAFTQVQPADYPPPAPLVPIDGDQFWPYTGAAEAGFSGTPQDPINVVFLGAVDPRDLRAALLFLDGDRSVLVGTPFEPLAMFDCEWEDALGGDVQTSYGQSAGWVGSAIQVQCGDYDPVRFHMRFFDIGGVTIAGAHFEFLIPGTSQHQVLAWELAEQLVVADFFRSGLLGDVPGSTGPINEAPTFDEIDAMVWDAIASTGLQELALASGAQVLANGNVGIGTDGAATTLTVAGTVNGRREIARQEFTINFDQLISKPFCQATPFDFVYATGPVELKQQVVVTPSGNYHSQFHALGTLNLLPLAPDPATGELVPTGEPYKAHVAQHARSHVTDNVTMVSQFILQIELPPSGPFRGSLQSSINVGPGNASHSALTVRCDP